MRFIKLYLGYLLLIVGGFCYLTDPQGLWIVIKLLSICIGSLAFLVIMIGCICVSTWRKIRTYI